MVGTFDTTSWSVVLSAKDGGSGVSRAALDALCRAYWPPLYAQIRRRGYSREDAEDLTQEFFTRLLEYDFLRRVERERGRFRTFLLASLDHFLADQRKWAHRQRRGGGCETLSLDFAEAEERLHVQARPDLDPRCQYDRQWAQTLLATVSGRLQREFAAAGKADLFEELRPCLVAGRETGPYRELEERFGVSAGTLKVAAHRLRRRYAQLLREEVARTVEDAAEVDEELRYLIEMLGDSAGSALQPM